MSNCLELQLLSSREGQHPLGQGRTPLRSLHGIVQEAVILGSSGRRLRIQFETAEHCHQQIVEVVGDAAGQLSDGFHLLGLKQRLARSFRASPASLCAP